MGMDLFKDIYGDLYGDAGRKQENLPEQNKTAGESEEKESKPGNDSGPDFSLEEELSALERAQRALTEAAEKFGRENGVPGAGSGETAIHKKGREESVKESGHQNTEQEKLQKDVKNTEQERMQEAAQTTEEKEPERDPMEELDELIGLSGIKHDVRELYDFTKIQKLRQDAGMKTVPVSKHLVFTGNPGTGKTTVARILARLYRKIGVLSKGQLVECDRSGLVAGYVGQTAVKTQKKIEEAMGGVLFIDEAYSLARGADQGSDFGQEAIDTLLKAMEDHRDDFIVIVAGYTKPMETFIQSNPGLKSRFNKFIEFPDYTVEELLQIFDLNCKKYQYVPDPEARDQVKTLLMLQKAKEPENFANARAVRNLFESIITNQARRIAEMEHPTAEDMQRIQLEDLRDDEDGSEIPAQGMPDTVRYLKNMEASDAKQEAGVADAECSAEPLNQDAPKEDKDQTKNPELVVPPEKVEAENVGCGAEPSGQKEAE